MKKLTVLLIALALGGCMNPISSWLLKRKAAQEQATAQAVQAASAKLQAGYEAQEAAANAVIANLKAKEASQAQLRQAVDTYVAGADTVLADTGISDQAKVIAAKVLVGYAKANGGPLTPAQTAWLLPIIQNLVQTDLAHQQAASAALSAKQGLLDQAKASLALKSQQTAALGQAKDAADAQVGGLKGQLQGAQAKLAGVVGSLNAEFAAHTGLVALLKSILFWVLAVVGLGAVLAILAILPPTEPIFLPISKLYRATVGSVLKLAFMPIHWLYDLWESWISKKAAAPAAAPAPAVPAKT